MLPPDGFESNRALPPAFRDALEADSARAPDAVLRRILSFVRALVRQIDDALGEVLAHVDLATTNLFFTSDHGDYAGHRGLIAKSPWISFDDLAKVPFFCVGPDVAGGRRISAPVQSADYVLTALELAGLELPKSIDDTRSLRAVLQGEPADEARAVFSCTSFGWPMVRKGALKYFHHAPTGDEMLFDLARDPGETQNLITYPSYAEAGRELRLRLEEKLAQGIPNLPRFDGVDPVTPDDDAGAAQVALEPAACVARAFALLTEESLVESSPVALAEAACSAVAGRSAKLDRSNTIDVVRELERLRGDAENAHWVAIGAMARAARNPHTLFLSADAQAQLVAALNGKPCSAPGFFAHEADGGWVVSEVLAGGPAAEAGLAPGDVVARIDGDDVLEGCLVDLWFRPAGSKVTLELRGSRTDAVVLSLWPWTPPLASFRVLPGGQVGVMRVYLFAGSHSAERSLMTFARAALSAFDRRSVERVVLDLRGTLGAAAMDEFISLFTTKDPLVVLRARNGEEAPVKRKGNAWPRRYALATLIDEQTTSAGAIVAAALEDLEGVISVGQPTKSVLNLPRPHALASGAFLYVPHFDVIGCESGEPRPDRRLVPSRIAPNRTVSDVSAGRDPQLETAAADVRGVAG
jgi:C-terminal processing protease CtpA/Prc